MDRIVRVRGALVLLSAALVVAGLSGATAAKKGLTKKKADKRYVNVGEKASDSDLLDGTDSSGFLGSDEKAADSELLDGMSPDAFQGTGITDLQAYCDLLEEPANYAPCITPSIVTVDDPANDVGTHTSIAIGTDGNPVISYHDVTDDTLKVAGCDDPACAGMDETITTVDDSLFVGLFTSIAIGTDGNPVISYHDVTGESLKVARCNDPACVGMNETINTVDDAATDVGYSTSLAIGTDGNPVISYHDGDLGTLKVARCNDPACAGTDETITTVDDPATDLGPFTSLAIGTDGNPVISYQDGDLGTLKVARCDDPACVGGGESISTVDDAPTGVGSYTSIAVGTDGNPVISYRDGGLDTLKVARCNDPACVGGGDTISTVDDAPTGVGFYTSIAVGTDGNPVISYHDGGLETLKVARCDDPACVGGGDTISTVDDSPFVGLFTSIAVGTDGNPVIGYYDDGLGTLKVARIPA